MEESQIVSSTLHTLRKQMLDKNSAITRDELDNLRYLLNELNKLHENLCYEYVNEPNNSITQYSQNITQGSRKRKIIHTSEISDSIRESVRYLANTIIDADDSLRYDQPHATSATIPPSRESSFGSSRNTDFSVSTLLASQATSPPPQRQNTPPKKVQKIRKPHKGLFIYTSDKINHLQCPRSIQTSTDEEGKPIFYIGGEQIVFKVPKNKPKNGAFLKQWEQAYASLCEFQKLYGHTNVTRSTPGWESLGSWVNEQRRKLRLGKIEDAQFQRLNEVGFEWDRSFYGEEAPTYTVPQKPLSPQLNKKEPGNAKHLHSHSEVVEGDN